MFLPLSLIKDKTHCNINANNTKYILLKAIFQGTQLTGIFIINDLDH